MIYVSKEKLDRDFERYSIDRWLNTTVNIMGKAAIPIVIIELIIAVAMQDKLQWWISMLIFAVLDFITPFIVCFSLIWINAGIKISKSAGGISAALKTSGTIKRSRPYFILIQNEICSDKVLAEAKRLAETANKQSYEYISSLCHLIGCHTLRCEFDEASACLEEMKKLPETDLISRNDHMIAILDYAMAKHDDDLFISAISEYADILNTLTERNPSAVPALLAIAAYEQMLYGNCENASQYLGWSMEYRLRMQKNGKRCRELDYSDKIDADVLLSIYRTAYKTHNARKQRSMKSNSQAEQKFKEWVVFAKQLLAHAQAGELSLEEYTELIKK